MAPINHLISSFHRLSIPKERKSCNLSVYLIANLPSFSRQVFFSKILAAVEGGVTCVQYRDYQSDFETTLKISAYLKKLLKNTPLFINTPKSVEIVQAIKADGVFLEDKKYKEARSRLGEVPIIGIPMRGKEDLLDAARTNALDYLSVKISASKQTCPRNDQIWSLEDLRTIRATSPIPIVAVGGLNLERAESIYTELRAKDGIAMAGGLMREEDPRLTAQKIQMTLEKIRSRS